MALVTGIDGCKAGWIAITLETETGDLSHAVFPDGESLFAAMDVPQAIAIDIPIGLPESGARVCDQEARRLLGRPRSRSVFPSPIRPALYAQSRGEADRITRGVDGRGVGAQAWNIYSRIREIDDLLRESPQLRDRVYESHPEVCFWALNGGQPMTCSKHTPEGLEERLRLIHQHFGAGSFHRLRPTTISSTPSLFAGQPDGSFWVRRQYCRRFRLLIPTDCRCASRTEHHGHQRGFFRCIPRRRLCLPQRI